MSEYQYYEFLAIDRPLTDTEQVEARALSTRATITATSFVNEYHWGSFRGSPNRMMELLYDAHLYLANWGTHRLMFRVPRDLLPPHVVEDYRVEGQLNAWTTARYVVLDFFSEDEYGEHGFEYDGAALLSAIIGVRAELAGGDLRPLYLAWLATHGTEERDEYDHDGEHEPPVPPGLGTLTGAQRALADFLRVDGDLLAIATQTSPPREEMTSDPKDLARRVARLPAAEKNELLARVVQGEATRVQLELLRRFHETTPAAPATSRRTVTDLLDDAARRRADRQRRSTAKRARDKARQEKAAAAARDRRLDQLAGDIDAAWSHVDALIATRKPAEYDAAVTLLDELRALAQRDGHSDAFTTRANALRQTHARKPSLIDRLNRASI